MKKDDIVRIAIIGGKWDRFSLSFRWNEKTFRPGNTNLPGWSFLFLGIIDGLKRYLQESQFDEINEMNGNKPFRAERRASYGITKVPRMLFLRTSCFSRTFRVICEDEFTMLVERD